jgi:hydroxymethylbilane synthase
MTTLRLGTRGSLLALTQSRTVAAAVERASGRPVSLVTIQTTGDQRLDRPLSQIGGKGLFTRELDVALLEGSIDFAVHSLKDLPTGMEEGLTVAIIPEREDPRDVLIGPEGGPPLSLSSLPAGARVGTSSLRRRALCLAFRPDLRVENLRGNLDTRIRKVDEGEVEAILVAGAGVRRLGLGRRIGEWVEAGAWLPAPGQGALGVVTRTGDRETIEALAPLHHESTALAVRAERALLHELEGGCQVPVGALAIPFGDRIRLRGVVASPDGRRVVLGEGTGDAGAPEMLGRQVALEMVARGADAILDEVRSVAPRPAPSS